MPTIDIPDKICPHCGGTKWYLFTYHKYKKSVCSLKKYEIYLKFKSLNPNKVKLYKKKVDKQKKFRLTNTYIKELIIQYTNLSFKDIPQELIELKRKQLLLKRKSKQNG
jgi:hypothetical protein